MSRIAKIVVFVLLFCIVFSIACHIVSRKNAEEKYELFFDNPEDIDVLMFGSSHMLNGIIAMDLWNNYGITSYNFGSHGCRIPTSYWMLKNALDYASPKVVILDCYMISADLLIDPEDAYLHLAFDAFPLTKNKYQAIDELLGESDNKLEFLFPFSSYHYRWSELTEGDFEKNISYERGTNIRIGLSEKNREENLMETYSGDGVCIAYIEKAVQLFKERNIDIILTYLPTNDDAWTFEESNRVKNLAQSLDVDYIDRDTMEDIVNYSCDFSDGDGHLNYSGAKAVTDYVGNYLINNYNLTDHREDPAYSHYFDEFSNYIDYEIKLISDQSNASFMLPNLQSNDFGKVIYLGNFYGEGWLTYSPIRAMMSAWGITSQNYEEYSNRWVFFSGNEKVILNENVDFITENEDKITILSDENYQYLYFNDKLVVEINKEDDIAIAVALINNSQIPYAAKFNNLGSKVE